MSKGRVKNVPRWRLHCHVLRMSRTLCKIYCYSSGGKNRPHFFSKLCAEKNDPCNTDYPRLLDDYWETKLLWQNYVIFQIKFIYTKNINQTNEVQTLSAMMNKLKQVNIYFRWKKLSTSFQLHVQWVRLWGAVLDKVKVVFLSRRSHTI